MISLKQFPILLDILILVFTASNSKFLVHGDDFLLVIRFITWDWDSKEGLRHHSCASFLRVIPLPRIFSLKDWREEVVLPQFREWLSDCKTNCKGETVCMDSMQMVWPPGSKVHEYRIFIEWFCLYARSLMYFFKSLQQMGILLYLSCCLFIIGNRNGNCTQLVYCLLKSWCHSLQGSATSLPNQRVSYFRNPITKISCPWEQP